MLSNILHACATVNTRCFSGWRMFAPSMPTSYVGGCDRAETLYYVSNLECIDARELLGSCRARHPAARRAGLDLGLRSALLFHGELSVPGMEALASSARLFAISRDRAQRCGRSSNNKSVDAAAGDSDRERWHANFGSIAARFNSRRKKSSDSGRSTRLRTKDGRFVISVPSKAT